MTELTAFYISLVIEAFRQFGRGRYRAALYQRCGAIMDVRGESVDSSHFLPEDAPEASHAKLGGFFKGET